VPRKQEPESHPDDPIKAPLIPVCVKCGAPQGIVKHYCDACVKKDLESMEAAVRRGKERRVLLMRQAEDLITDPTPTQMSEEEKARQKAKIAEMERVPF